MRQECYKAIAYYMQFSRATIESNHFHDSRLDGLYNMSFEIYFFPSQEITCSICIAPVALSQRNLKTEVSL